LPLAENNSFKILVASLSNIYLAVSTLTWNVSLNKNHCLQN